jgi:hypothetical protein
MSGLDHPRTTCRGARPIDLAALTTEGRSAELADLDLRPTAEIVRAVVRGHADVVGIARGGGGRVVLNAFSTAVMVRRGRTYLAAAWTPSMEPFDTRSKSGLDQSLTTR